MLPTGLQIRNALLSATPSSQEDMARRLGLSQPHIELVALCSALRMDLDDSWSSEIRLHSSLVKPILNAACRHLASLPLMSPAAQQDTIGKVQDVYDAGLSWMHQCDHHMVLAQHLLGLKAELKDARARYGHGQEAMPAIAA